MSSIDINQIAIQLAPVVAEKVSSEVQIIVAWIGVVGVLSGAIVTFLGQFLLHWYQDRPKRRLDAQREKILKQMLSNNNTSTEWRKIETLSRVVGANGDETKRLLIKIGARGSEKENDVWALIENKPLDQISEDNLKMP